MLKYTQMNALLFIILTALSSSRCIDLDNLFSQMTLEDKCGQMTQVEANLYVITYPPPATPFNASNLNSTKIEEALRDKRVGSFIAPPYTAPTKADWQSYINFIQDKAKNFSPFGIPILYAVDSIHGTGFINESVLFPQALAQASTFNLNIAHKIGEITAMEQRASGVPWNFNPVLDIGRQPLWPRLYETYGEDVYLASKMGEAYIKGQQGTNDADLKNRTRVGTCLKHYLGYSFPFNGRDRTSAYIGDVQLREFFLPTFEQGVAAGALTVMINSASVNGIPGHSNSYYINDILKGELGFKGFVVSDWQDIIRLHTRDKVAETPEEAVRLAVMAGVDMSMVPADFSFYDHCVNLGKKDLVFSRRVDDAAMRILRVKEKLGLFENPYAMPQDLVNIGTQESEDFNLEAARESIILAKNDGGVLPLSLDKRILVTGPTGNVIRSMTGGWSYSWQGDEEDLLVTLGRKKLTVYEAIKAIATSGEVKYVEGANFDVVTNLNEAVNEAQNSDVIVLCIGESSYAENIGNINSLMLSDSQRTLSSALGALNKTIVVVYLGGRPRVMTDIGLRAQAALISFFPGSRGGEAIADILFGRYNPNARLPITYPRYPNGITTYDHPSLEEGQQYQYLFRFGHGLSYTTFEYTRLILSTRDLLAPNDLSISVNVRNSGGRTGKEVVMLFLNDVYGSVPRPVRQLKKFEKIELASGETKTVIFTLSLNDLTFINLKSKRVYEPGRFNVYIGNLNDYFVLRV